MLKVCEVQIGSRSYNTHTDDSDDDKMIFYVPQYHDLLEEKKMKEHIIEDSLDVKNKDIRDLIFMANKPNISNINPFFSNEVHYCEHDTHPKTIVSNALLDAIFSMGDEILESDLPGLFKSCYGIFNFDMKIYDKDPANNFKHATHAYRALDFIIRYHHFDHDGGLALRYDDSDFSREALLKMKSGKLSEDEIRHMLNHLENIALTIKPHYMNRVAYNEPKEKLKGLINELIWTHMSR